ncbi:antiterminator LoaP [Bacillus velezensis]|uniref:antiterminator LoaP n=1 Tax=Bacillus velezensis TaxID=492670 RepID=UPI0022F3CA61|nr:antiterminator LoaP [Bacillus velezensis]WBY44309.1 antiterminator LoaP [Bacillus velezensis]
MKWYALFVESGKEEIVQKFLRLQFDEQALYSIIPKKKVTERKAGIKYEALKKMFPGYVLFKTKMTERTFHKTKELPISCRIVNNGAYYSKERKTYFTTITDEEILPIIRLIGEGDTVDYSKVYIENSKVTVASGPLKGMEGIIKKIDKRKRRAKICLSFMGLDKMVNVGIEVLSKP